MHLRIIASSAGLLVATASSHAAVTLTPSHNGGQRASNPGFTVSDNDLINGKTAVASSGNWTFEGSAGLSVLTNGVFGHTGSSDYSQAASAGQNSGGGGGAGRFAVYAFTGPATIDSIATYTGWGDSGRDQQSYTVAYTTDATVSADSTWIDIATADFNFGEWGNGTNSRVVISTDNAAPLATGATGIRFFFNPQENGWTGYRELDVIGTIPEPASLALLALGGLAMLRRRG